MKIHVYTARLDLTTLVGLIAILVTGCSKESAGPAAAGAEAPSGPSRTAAETATACAHLATDKRKDVTIDEAVSLPFSEHQGLAPGQPVRVDVPNCKVTGVIDGSIKFELLLPDAWNGKFLMGGGGGFVGSVQNQALDGMSAGKNPLERGYATAGTDTGHTGEVIDASWALNNDQAKENFAHRAVHRTAEVSKEIIKDYYGDGAERSYFLGCSRGGGQGMISAQRYPDDFDGIVAGAPVLDWAGTTAGFLRNEQAVFPNPDDLTSPVITADNRKLLADGLGKACDYLDGVKDGLISDPRRCKFDPTTLPLCSSDAAAECLTEPQLAAIQAIYRGPVAGGQQIHPGFPFGGESDAQGWDLWITQTEPATLPPGVPNLHYAFGTQFAKYFVYNDPNWNYASFDLADWHVRAAPAGQLLNAINPDLSKFRDAGGKLILWHGWSDSALTALSSVQYYESVQRQDKALGGYFRMYLMPGVGHCSGGPGPDRADWITAIERWVENDSAPEAIQATKTDPQGGILLERPVCPHPESAAYDDTGDSKLASSFRCGLSGG